MFYRGTPNAADDLAIFRPNGEHADLAQDAHTRLSFDFAPKLEGALHERHIGGIFEVGLPDHAALAARRAEIVTAAELIEANRARAALRTMREDRTAHPETHDCNVVGHKAQKNFCKTMLNGIVAGVKETGWMVRVGRIGYVAKGLVFICIGLFSAAAAVARGAGATDSRGLMQAIVQQPFGQGLLLALIAGLVCYVAWLVVAAFADAEDQGIVAHVRALFLAVIYSGIVALAVKALTRGTQNGGDDRSAQSWTATALARPFGSTLVVLIGAGVVIAGGLLMRSGWQADSTKARGMSGASMPCTDTFSGARFSQSARSDSQFLGRPSGPSLPLRNCASRGSGFRPMRNSVLLV